MIQSDSTRVPPVTEEKSPPDSRITGADSPVMALSSTEATPPITSPSAGMTSWASTSTTSPLRRSSAFTGIVRGSPGLTTFFAMTVWRMPRSAEACARLRPSASASAKFANSTVNKQPDADGKDRAGARLAVTGERLDIEQSRDDGADVHHEHDGIAPLHARIQLGHGLEQRGPQEVAVEQRERRSRHRVPQRPPGSIRCSTTGPSASAGT